MRVQQSLSHVVVLYVVTAQWMQLLSFMGAYVVAVREAAAQQRQLIMTSAGLHLDDRCPVYSMPHAALLAGTSLMNFALRFACSMLLTYGCTLLLRWGQAGFADDNSGWKRLSELYERGRSLVGEVRGTSGSGAEGIGAVTGGDSSNLVQRNSSNPFRLRDPLSVPVVIERRRCVICLEDLTVEHFANRGPSAACHHPSIVCTPCLGTYVEACISSRASARCPTPDCSAYMQYEDVHFWASREVFEKYDTRMLRLKLSAMSGFTWCVNSECDAGQFCTSIGTAVSPKIVTCSSCGTKSCSFHSVPWHEGLTCTQFDEKRRREVRKKATEKLTHSDKRYLRAHTKSCPKCGIAIQKTEGCDHMTCKPPGGCGYEFCWSCLGDYKDIRKLGNHMHKRGCRFYRPLGAPERPRSRFFWGLFRRRRTEV